MNIDVIDTAITTLWRVTDEIGHGVTPTNFGSIGDSLLATYDDLGRVSTVLPATDSNQLRVLAAQTRLGFAIEGLRATGPQRASVLDDLHAAIDHLSPSSLVP